MAGYRAASRSTSVRKHYWTLHTQPEGAWAREFVHSGAAATT
ncbi:hypothetical protein [Amycolatopsis acidicola]|nr:hypothetical protein [Amycolatopsis acidicola]